MPRINMNNAINSTIGKIDSRYDLSYGDVLELMEDNDKYNIVNNSFRFGYIQGMKAAKAEMKKRRVETNG
ncbi:MAG: hypothetical protein HFE68_04135 [Erysipelotrichaceae bacterium]|nr:hypothetical protein [Erysipelotrichaceae bacterium]